MNNNNKNVNEITSIDSNYNIISYDHVYQKREKNTSRFDVANVKPGTYGGLTFIDDAITSKQYEAIKDLIGQMGRNIMERKSLINISLPVSIFEPRSFLQRITDVWGFAPIYLTKAAKITDNPLERLKYVIVFLISGLHRGSKQVKPFNPILGETFQSKFLDGTHIYCEQVSHHPPITQFEVHGPHKQWMFQGCHEYAAHFTSAGVEGGQYGPNRVVFNDGDVITFNMPSVRLSGIVVGERNFTYFDKITFESKKNHLKAEIQFDPDGYTGLTSWVATAATPTDTIRGHIKDDRNQIRCKIEGSWINKLMFNDETYWNIGECKVFTPIIQSRETTLPSDCYKRTDIEYLRNGDVEKAQTEKIRLENVQRFDRKLREKSMKSQRQHNDDDDDGKQATTTSSGWGLW